jgi:hypothetical protein
MLRRLNCIAALFVAALMIAGCGTDEKAGKKDDKGHDDHEHAHGPNKGHFAHFKSDDGTEIDGEYVVRAKTNTVELYILDGHTEKAGLKPIAIEKITLTSKGNETKTFEAMAEKPEDGMASMFVAQGEDVVTAFGLGVDASFVLDGKTYMAKQIKTINH